MKKKIVSLILTVSILLSLVPLNVLMAFAKEDILYGDANGSGRIELLDVNLMERYIEGDEEAQTGMEQLMDRYKEMLEQECDWVEIYNRPVTDNEFLKQ